MVAFRYDNGAVGSLYYSREIPSLLRGLRISKLFGREGVITLRVQRRVRAGARRRAARVSCSRASATFAATRRCTVTSSARFASGAAPEMSLERAIEDQRLMDQYRYASRLPRGALDDAHERTTSSSSAAAPAAARWRTRSRRRGAGILVLERGGFIARKTENWEPGERSGRTRATRPKERWLDEHGRRVSAVHPLQRGRQHASSGAACSIDCAARTSRTSSTSTACRRRGRSTTTRWRRTTIGPSVCTTSHGELGIDPTDPPSRPFPHHAPMPHETRMAAIVGSAPQPSACIHRRCRSDSSDRVHGCIAATPATPSRATCTRRATPTCAVCARRCRSQRHAVDEFDGHPADDEPVGQISVDAVEIDRLGETIRVEAPMSSCRAEP